MVNEDVIARLKASAGSLAAAAVAAACSPPWVVLSQPGGPCAEPTPMPPALQAAEEEAQRLKRELAAAQAAAAASGSGAAAADAAAAERAAQRIDGGDLRRETLFSGVESKQRNWLSESDVAFFTGGGPGEADGEGVRPEDQAVVQVRVRACKGGSGGMRWQWHVAGVAA